MEIRFTTTTNGPDGKLADAELHFTDGPLAGLKLIGFAVWQRRTGSGRNVTFPARTYSVNGDRRSFALLRPADGNIASNDGIRNAIIDAYAAFERGEDRQPTPRLEQPAAVQHIATPAGPVADRTFGTAADYGSRSEPEQPTPAAKTAPAGGSYGFEF